MGLTLAHPNYAKYSQNNFLILQGCPDASDVPSTVPRYTDKLNDDYLPKARLAWEEFISAPKLIEQYVTNTMAIHLIRCQLPGSSEIV